MSEGKPTYSELEARVAELEAQVASLLKKLEEQKRKGKRQAAPFSKGPPKAKAKTPGRKSGEQYGDHKRRAIPETIDEIHDAPLPDHCPHCDGVNLIEETLRQQYQIEIPRSVIHRQFEVHCGHCADCGKRVQGHHELQTNDALGAAAVQFGPNLQAAIAILNKEVGLTHGKIQRLFSVLFNLILARSACVRSMLRTAKKVEPVMNELRAEVRGSPVVKVDETGWKTSGLRQWLHVAVAQRVVLYSIGSRGYDATAAVIGAGFDGTLKWTPVIGPLAKVDLLVI